MPEQQGNQYIVFKLLLVVGGLLGVLLLVQGVRNYLFVSDRMVEEELYREAARHNSYLQQRVREEEAREPDELRAVLAGVLEERKGELAWFRIQNLRGEIVAEAGSTATPAFPVDRLRHAFEDGGRISKVVNTDNGKVMVTLRPLRLWGLRRPGREGFSAGQSPPGSPRAPEPPSARSEPRGGAPPPRPIGASGPYVAEIALHWHSVDPFFSPLRRNLIINFAAAIALLAAMAFIGLRFRGYVRGRQLEQQLDVARGVQQDLLPSNCPSYGNLDIAAHCDPAWQVGGDFYDVFQSEDGHIAMILGDVSGKGLPAALLMGLIHGAIRASSWNGAYGSLSSATRRLNELLCTRTSVERFATMFWCYYDQRRQVLRYVNAGHLPPYVVRRTDGVTELIRLEAGGLVVGVLPSAPYQEGEIRLQAGDLLVLYSDGVVEAANARGEEFGEERLARILERSQSRPAFEVRDEILRQVRLFMGNQPPQDDLTILVVRAGAAVQDDKEQPAAEYQVA